jgi:uncharacterized protein (TIGR02444 family)
LQADILDRRVPLQLIEFALAFYADKQVAGQLLAWQDRLGADVNVLIYAIWLGVAKSAVAGDRTIGEADDAIADWRGSVILPLRGVRKALAGFQDTDGEAAAAIRESVKRIEIEAELVALRRLAALPVPPAASPTGAGPPALENRRCALRFISGADADVRTEKELRWLAGMAAPTGSPSSGV